MGRPGRIIVALRDATVVAIGALAVHEATYLVGFGAASHAGEGHSHVAAMLPVLAILVAVSLFATIERGVAGAGSRRAAPVRGIGAYAAAILALFGFQEAVESVLAAADPAALLALESLVALPLALCLGSLGWLAVRALEAIECRIAERFERIAHRPATSSPRPPRLAIVLIPAASAAGAAPRAPPAI